MAECCYGECSYVEGLKQSLCADCRYAECRCAECHYAENRGASYGGSHKDYAP